MLRFGLLCRVRAPAALLHMRTFCKFARFSQEWLWENLQEPSALSPSDLASVAFRFAKGNKDGIIHDTFDFKACLKRISEELENFTATDMSKLFVFCQRVRVEEEFWKNICVRARDCTGYTNEEMVLLLNHYLHSVNSRLTRLYLQPQTQQKPILLMTEKGLLQTIRSHMSENARDLTPQQITDVLIALSTLKILDVSLLTKLCSEALAKSLDFTPVHLSKTLHALCVLKFDNEELVSKFCLEALVKVGAFDGEDLSLFIYSMVEMGKGGERNLLEKMCAQAKLKAKSFEGVAIARLITALGAAKYQDKELFQILTSEMLHKHAKCNATEITKLLEAFARLGFFYKPLVRQLRMNAARVKIRQFTAEQMALTLDSLLALGINYDEFMVQKFTEQAVSQKWPSQDYAVLIAAVSRYGHHPKELLEAIIAAKHFQHTNFDAELSSRLFYACAQKRVYDDRLFNALSSAALKCVDEFSAQQIAFVMEGLATGEFFDEALIQALCIAAYEKYADFKAAQAATVLKSLAVFELYDEPLVHRLTLQAMSQKIDSVDLRKALRAVKQLKETVQQRPITNALAEAHEAKTKMRHERRRERKRQEQEAERREEAEREEEREADFLY